MATFSKATNSTKKPFEGAKRDIFVLRNTINLADSSQFPTKPVQNDIIEALAIPANTLVEAVILDIQTGEGEAVTIDVGRTGVSANEFFDDQSIQSATKVASGPKGKLFNSADTIDFLCNTNATYNAAKITIYAICIDVTSDT